MFIHTRFATATLASILLLSVGALPHLRRQSNGTIPSCITDCMSQNDSRDWCDDFSDLECICVNAAFLQDVVLCTQRSCDSMDITEVLSVYINECGLPATNDGSSLPNGASSFVPTNGAPGIPSLTMATPTTGTYSTSNSSTTTPGSSVSTSLMTTSANSSRFTVSESTLITSHRALPTANTSETFSLWSVDSPSSTRTSNVSLFSTPTSNSSTEGPEDVSLSGGVSYHSRVAWSFLSCLISTLVGASLL
ncbi:hypothetical protein GY45DRAFT_207689 [Cubamyces sp. BRFM 1775]|nr:hypothetical protein GY45DRAFT_207689 [Cubamyces sp. BRFM 1775]